MCIFHKLSAAYPLTHLRVGHGGSFAGNVSLHVNAIDYSDYPNCRLEFIEAFECMANLAIRAAVEGKMKIGIQTPHIQMSKVQIIKRGNELEVDYIVTHLLRPGGRWQAVRRV